MKLKASLFDTFKHCGSVPTLAWSSNDEVYSCGDDHLLVRWNFAQNEAVTIAKLPNDFYPTSLQWFPKTVSSGKKSTAELLAASADGKFHFLNKNGRFDRSIDAHQGAVLVALWSSDGAGLLTGGEDGHVKIWSRSGMLRSTVISGDVPVYTAAWGPDSNHILVSQSRTLLLKPLAPNTKPTRWRAHDGLILKVSWNHSNNLIASTGEDCRYKVWDVQGNALYTSSPHDYPLTSIAWTPAGDAFAVASFNTLRLCDRVGWSHSLEKVQTGAIYDLEWSPDGTQLAGACGNGSILFAHVVQRQVEWKNFEVILNTPETIEVCDVRDDAKELLEFNDRISNMALAFDHLVVTTSSQCQIFSTSNWNTPIIVQLKNCSSTLLSLTSKYFVLMDRINLNIYGYDGKIHWTPKIPGTQMDTLGYISLSLSPDALAVVDQMDSKVVHIIDLLNSRQTALLPSIHHSQGVVQVALSQTGSSAERLIAFLDHNRDAYLKAVRVIDGSRPSKLGTMVSCLMWSAEAPLLAAIRDSTLNVWCCPQALHIDKNLLRRTTFTRDLSDIGRGVALVNFVCNLVTLRRSDGSLVKQSVPPYISTLLNFVADEKWDDALHLCRFVDNELLWSCLACLATVKKDIATAEESFAVINELDKVAYVQFIKSIPLQPARSAYLALLSGNVTDAENILLMNGLVFRAIMLLIDSYDWVRALDLAVKHRTHVDTVLYKRKMYLESLNKQESNDKFLQYKEVVLDADAIKEKLELAFVKEREDV